MNDQAGRSIPIVAHVFTLDCESFKLQLGKGKGNWYEVQITGRRRSLPGRACLSASLNFLVNALAGQVPEQRFHSGELLCIYREPRNDEPCYYDQFTITMKKV